MAEPTRDALLQQAVMLTRPLMIELHKLNTLFCWIMPVYCSTCSLLNTLLHWLMATMVNPLAEAAMTVFMTMLFGLLNPST